MWIFEVIEKTGRSIHLSKERWIHIQEDHPEMSGKIEEIQETLRYPTSITNEEDNPTVHFYYRYAKGRKQYLFVAIKYLNGKGYIITSYYTDKIK